MPNLRLSCKHRITNSNPYNCSINVILTTVLLVHKLNRRRLCGHSTARRQGGLMRHHPRCRARRLFILYSRNCIRIFIWNFDLISNIFLRKIRDPKITNIYDPKIVSFPMPRYLLRSQSSIPALQAMWRLAREGTPATSGPLEAPISAKLPKNIFKWKSALLNETVVLSCGTPLFKPLGLKF